MRRADECCDIVESLPGVEDNLRDDDQIGTAADRGHDVVVLEAAVRTRLDERQRDAPAPCILAQDHVDRVELAAQRDDARDDRGVERVQNRAQSLTGAGLRHDAVAARCAQQSREPVAIRRALGHPRVPRAAHAVVPRRESLAHVVVHRIERPAERVVGEVNAAGAAPSTRENSGATCSASRAR